MYFIMWDWQSILYVVRDTCTWCLFGTVCDWKNYPHYTLYPLFTLGMCLLLTHVLHVYCIGCLEVCTDVNPLPPLSLSLSLPPSLSPLSALSPTLSLLPSLPMRCHLRYTDTCDSNSIVLDSLTDVKRQNLHPQ